MRIQTMRMHISLLKLTLIVVFAALMQAGTSRGSDGSTNSAKELKSLFTFKGKVVDARGKGIGGVVVNDGYSFTQTSRDGSWKLMTDTTRSKFVSISIPAGYDIPEHDGLADGYFIPVRKLAATRRHNFRLTRRKKPADKFCYIAISDPQIANAHDLERWKNESVPDIHSTVSAAAASREVVGMVLGDIVFDNMQIYDEYVRSVRDLGMPTFHCIGNHDFDKSFKSLAKMPAGSPTYAEMEFNRHFGPTAYSFNIGKVHVVTLKDIDYKGDRQYVERIPEEQMEWLIKDLSYVPKGTTVFLNMHAAAWNTVHNKGNIRNAEQLKEALSGYNVHVFCGHTHFYQNIEASNSLYQHNIGAVCGAWWTCNVNRCGAPNGYLVVDVNGNDVRWHYKSTGKPLSTQMRIYPEGTYKSEAGCIVANVWDWDNRCSVKWYEDGRLMGSMTRFTDTDPTYVSTQEKDAKKVPTAHLFKACPSAGVHKVKVVFTNRFGEQFADSIMTGGNATR